MSVNVASVNIIARLMGGQKVRQDWRQMQNELNKVENIRHNAAKQRAMAMDRLRQINHQRELSRIAAETAAERRRGAAIMSSMRRMARNVMSGGPIFTRGNAQTITQTVRFQLGDFSSRLNSAARKGGREFAVAAARGTGRRLMMELKGITSNLPGAKTVQKIPGLLKGPVIGQVLSKTIMGPADLLAIPSRLGAMVADQALGAILVMVPAMIRQLIGAVGAAVAPLPGIIVSALAVAQKGVIDLARKTGEEVNKLRDLFSVGGIFGGKKVREDLMKFSDQLDQVAAGTLKRNKGTKTNPQGEFTSKSQEIMKQFEVLKGVQLSGSSENLFQQLASIQGKGRANARFDVLFEALMKLRQGDLMGADGKAITGEKADELFRRISSLMGDAAGTETRRDVDQAIREGMSAQQFGDRRRRLMGTITDQAVTDSDVIISKIKEIFQALSGQGAGILNENVNVVRQWFEDLATFLGDERLKEERIKAFTAVFKEAAKDISAFFEMLRTPSPDAGGSFVMDSIGETPVLQGEDRRVLFIRQVRDFFIELVKSAQIFYGTVSKTFEIIKEFASGTSGETLSKFAKVTGGAFGGFLLGVPKAINAQFSDGDKDEMAKRLEILLGETLRGAGVNVSDKQASGKFGELFEQMISFQLERLNKVIESTPAFVKMGGLFVKKFMEGANQEGGLHTQLKNLVKNSMEAVTGVAGTLFDGLTDKGNLELMMAYGVDLGKAIANGVLQGLAAMTKGTALGNLFAGFLDERVRMNDRLRDVNAEITRRNKTLERKDIRQRQRDDNENIILDLKNERKRIQARLALLNNPPDPGGEVQRVMAKQSRERAEREARAKKADRDRIKAGLIFDDAAGPMAASSGLNTKQQIEAEAARLQSKAATEQGAAAADLKAAAAALNAVAAAMGGAISSMPGRSGPSRGPQSPGGVTSRPAPAPSWT